MRNAHDSGWGGFVMKCGSLAQAIAMRGGVEDGLAVGGTKEKALRGNPEGLFSYYEVPRT
jgi:hypothetical protein